MINDVIPQDKAVSAPAVKHNGDEVIDLAQLVMPIWYRKWRILSFMLIVMMLSALVVLNMTPVYQASTTLLIEQRNNKLTTLEELYGLQTNSAEYLLTQFELLKSRELTERVVDKLDLINHPEFDPRQREPSLVDSVREMISDFDFRKLLPFTMPEDLQEEPDAELRIREATVRALMAQTTISPVRKTQLVEISIEMTDAATAAEAANALARAYIESQLEAKLDVNLTATSWMNDQLGVLKENLQDSERRLQDFRERENLVDVKGVATLSTVEISSTSERLQDARRTRAELESQYRQIMSVPDGDWRKLASLPAILSDPLVQEFRTAEAKARSKVEDFARRYGPKYPKMISAQTELDAASENLRAQVEEVVHSIERKRQLAVVNESELEASLNVNKGEIQDITRKEFTLRELEREVETNRQLYDTFLTRLKETSASQDFEVVNARIAERAVVPDVPVKPKKSLIVILSGVLALFVGIALVWLNEMLSNTFKSTSDVENHLNLPVFGVLPLLKIGKDKTLVDVFQQDSDKGFSEAVRTMRTSVVFSTMENDRHQVILVTSSVPGEGKTTVSANLAYSLSSMHPTLLVEADLRKPNLRKNFNLPVGTPGVANILSGTAAVEDCINSVTAGLDVIVAGMVPPNPQELLSSTAFFDLMSTLKGKYKYVIIDSPPTLAVSDAIVLSAFADSLIYVIKSLSTKVPMAQKGIGSLLQKKAPVSGVVINQVDMKNADKYGYSYSGYYDYYGYSSGKSTA